MSEQKKQEPEATANQDHDRVAALKAKLATLQKRCATLWNDRWELATAIFNRNLPGAILFILVLVLFAAGLYLRREIWPENTTATQPTPVVAPPTTETKPGAPTPEKPEPQKPAETKPVEKTAQTNVPGPRPKAKVSIVDMNPSGTSTDDAAIPKPLGSDATDHQRNTEYPSWKPTPEELEILRRANALRRESNGSTATAAPNVPRPPLGNYYSEDCNKGTLTPAIEWCKWKDAKTIQCEGTLVNRSDTDKPIDLRDSVAFDDQGHRHFISTGFGPQFKFTDGGYESKLYPNIPAAFYVNFSDADPNVQTVNLALYFYWERDYPHCTWDMIPVEIR